MVGLRVSLVLAFAPLLGNCASMSGFPDNPISAGSDLNSLARYFSPTVFYDYDTAPTDMDRIRIERQVVYGRLAAYDIEYAEFQQNINKERAAGDLTGDLTSLALTATGASVGAKVTKTALLAATTAVTGAKTSFDTDLFYNKALQATFSQMDANRASVRALIDKKMAQNVTNTNFYSLNEAITDTLAYREAGSIPGALNGMATNAGNQKRLALEAEAKIFGLY